MPRIAGGLRRKNAATRLEDMTDDELADVAHFGNLIGSGPTDVTFRATEEQRADAWRLLKEREAARDGAI
jgi:hypothetical protein